MSDVSRLRIKLGKRYWQLVILPSGSPAGDASALLGDDGELLVVVLASEGAATPWLEWTKAQPSDAWEARLVPVIAHAELIRAVSAPLLVIGPAGLVERFVAGVVPDAGGQAAIVTPAERSTGETTFSLPDPADVPRFAEEGQLDPFGQDKALKAAAWQGVATTIGQLAETAHRAQLAMTLPNSPRGIADPQLKPWRTVLPLDAAPEETLADALERPQRTENPKQPDAGLALAQRALLVAAIGSQRGAQVASAGQLAALLEDLGYLLVSRSVDIANSPFGFYFEGGALAARIHASGHRFIDFHPGNFGLTKDKQRPLGERAMLIDYPAAVAIGREPTVRERAQDLAVMKLQCSFVQWEAVKFGYFFIARELAEQVFELI